jgi:hypothetical protein
MEMIGSLAGTGLGLAGGLMDLNGRKAAHKKQQEALRHWYMQQMAFRAMEQGRQEHFRNQADTSRLNTLYGDVSNIAQKGKALAEEGRLTNEYWQGTSAAAPSASDAAIRAGVQAGALTGQSGGGKEFTSDLARRLNNAAQDSRSRIKAMATLGSYGNSLQGLGTENPLAFARSAADINMFNNFRKGSLAAYGIEKAIEPQQIGYRQPMASMGLQALGGALSGMGGGGGEGMF